MELKISLKKMAEKLGADFFGIANLSPAQEKKEKEVKSSVDFSLSSELP